VARIPRTSSGKVIRREVAALVAPGPPTAAGPASAQGGPVDHYLDRPDGARIHVTTVGSGDTLVLLHATLSNARELRPLTVDLAADFRVVAVDRRGAGESTMPPDDDLGAVDVARHLEDLAAVLDAHAAPEEQVLVVGHSFGGCVALELAARRPERVAGTWVYEPPYLPVLEEDDGGRPDLAALGERMTELARTEGLESAALAFLDAVRGPGTSARIPSSARERLAAEGRSAVADAALQGLDPRGLADIASPVVVALGGRSGPPYGAVAERLAALIPSLEVERLADLGHGAPVSQPATVAAAIRAFARRLGDPAQPTMGLS
jgi:pimeloyl-ACP methyl ester carboxylesterase